MTDAPRAGDLTGEETVMNMTPMIDIVFQLIIFFLLSLKFKTVDERIDAQLPPVGLEPIPIALEPAPKIKLKLIRRNKGAPDAYTLVKVDNSHQLALPEGGDRNAARAQLLALIGAKWDAVGRDPEAYGEIVTPPPHGGSVPHGDAIFALDTFVAAGIREVRFEGTRMP